MNVGQIKEFARMWQGTQERRAGRDEEEKKMKGQLSALLCLLQLSVLQDARVRKTVNSKYTHSCTQVTVLRVTHV